MHSIKSFRWSICGDWECVGFVIPPPPKSVRAVRAQRADLGVRLDQRRGGWNTVLGIDEQEKAVEAVG